MLFISRADVAKYIAITLVSRITMIIMRAAIISELHAMTWRIDCNLFHMLERCSSRACVIMQGGSIRCYIFFNHTLQ